MVLPAPRPPNEPHTHLPRHPLIAHYELIRLLARGGMGMVFLARDTKLGRRVAIKLLHCQEPVTTQRFLVEAQARGEMCLRDEWRARLGRVGESRAQLERALAAWTARHGRDHPVAERLRADLALLLAGQNDATTAHD